MHGDKKLKITELQMTTAIRTKKVPIRLNEGGYTFPGIIPKRIVDGKCNFNKLKQA